LNVQLEQYEGPLDLLLDLIRKQQIDVCDIPIARITAQYLGYMEKAMALDMELGSEFVYMAATLIHIKSKMLLPKDPELENVLAEEDPRQELVERLIEHERFKTAAEMLQQKRIIEENTWSNPQIQNFVAEDETPGLSVTLFDLVKTLQTVLDRAKSRPIYEVSPEEVGVPEMIFYIRRRLEELPPDGHISARELFESQRTQRAMICLFLAILELVKLQAVQLVQPEAFGEISLRRHGNYDLDAASEKTIEAIEKDYQ
jgi:segregation and condensation protein A